MLPYLGKFFFLIGGVKSGRVLEKRCWVRPRAERAALGQKARPGVLSGFRSWVTQTGRGRMGLVPQPFLEALFRPQPLSGTPGSALSFWGPKTSGLGYAPPRGGAPGPPGFPAASRAPIVARLVPFPE